MRSADLYTKIVLTVVMGLLAWNTVAQFHPTTARAESTQYGVEVITAKLPLPLQKWGSPQYAAALAAGLKNSAKGRELVT